MRNQGSVDTKDKSIETQRKIFAFPSDKIFIKREFPISTFLLDKSKPSLEISAVTLLSLFHENLM